MRHLPRLIDVAPTLERVHVVDTHAFKRLLREGRNGARFVVIRADEPRQLSRADVVLLDSLPEGVEMPEGLHLTLIHDTNAYVLWLKTRRDAPARAATPAGTVTSSMA